MVQLTFKKLLFIDFWFKIEEYPQLSEEAIKILLFLRLHVCVRPDFLHILQLK